MRSCLAVLLCASVLATGCGARSGVAARPAAPGETRSPAPRVSPEVMAEFIRQLPVGARVKVVRADGATTSGTLMRGNADPILVQARTRIPEPPVEIPIAEILAVELHKGPSTARTVAIAVGAAAAAQLSMWLVLVAIFSD